MMLIIGESFQLENLSTDLELVGENEPPNVDATTAAAAAAAAVASEAE